LGVGACGPSAQVMDDPLSHLFCLGVTHHDAPVEVREKLSLSQEATSRAISWLSGHGAVGGAVVVSTCNRTEFYCSLSGQEEPSSLMSDLYQEIGQPLDAGLLDYLALRRGMAVCDHLFRVVAGMDSMVLGETEIFGQVKQAYDLACRASAPCKYLHRLFQSAFRAGKQVRSQTAITRGSVSVGSVSVELAEQIFGELAPRRVVVIGAGDTGEKVARALVSRGVKTVIVANRTYEHANELATMLGGRAARYDSLPEEFLHADIVISSTAAPGFVIGAREFSPLLARRAGRPLLLVDLAVPRDIDPVLGEHDDVYLFNVDDLQSIAEEHMKEREQVLERAVAIISVHAGEYLRWQTAQQSRGSGEPSRPSS